LEGVLQMSGTITALKVQARNPNRVNVFLDGEFAFGLERITAAWLRVGQVLSDEKIAELKQQDEQEVVYRKALHLLEYRPRAEEEIRRKLSKKEISQEVINQVIERLRRNNLVNDEQFAQAWVENRSTFRPRSLKALRYEMRQKGISSADMDQALTNLEVNEEELAYQAALKQSRKLNQLDKMDFRRKLFGFLARRGFSYATSAPVVERIWQEISENNE
jgi:regulatory protein